VVIDCNIAHIRLERFNKNPQKILDPHTATKSHSIKYKLHPNIRVAKIDKTVRNKFKGFPCIFPLEESKIDS